MRDFFFDSGYHFDWIIFILHHFRTSMCLSLSWHFFSHFAVLHPIQLVASYIRLLSHLLRSTSYPGSLSKLSMDCCVQFWPSEESAHSWCLPPASTLASHVRSRGSPPLFFQLSSGSETLEKQICCPGFSKGMTEMINGLRGWSEERLKQMKGNRLSGKEDFWTGREPWQGASPPLPLPWLSPLCWAPPQKRTFTKLLERNCDNVPG